MAKRTLSIVTNQVIAAAEGNAVLRLSLDSDELVVAPDGIISLAEQQLKTDENGTASVTLWPSAQLSPPSNYRIVSNTLPPCIFTMPDADSDLHTLCGAGPSELPLTPTTPATPGEGGPTTLTHPTTVLWEYLGTFGPFTLTNQVLHGTGIIIPADVNEYDNLLVEEVMDAAANFANGSGSYKADSADLVRNYQAPWTDLPIAEVGDPIPDQHATNRFLTRNLARTAERELLHTVRLAGVGTYLKTLTVWRDPYRTIYPRE